MKKIFAFIAVPGLLALTGCGHDVPEEEPMPTPPVIEVTEAPTTLPEVTEPPTPDDPDALPLEDGLFFVSIDPEYGLEVTDQSDGSVTLSGENGSGMNISSVSGDHYAVEGFAPLMFLSQKEGYSETTVQEHLDQPIPHIRKFAEKDDGMVHTFDLYQHGNGDILTFHTFEPIGTTTLADIVDDIAATAQYTGKPLRSETDYYSCEQFTIAVPPEWRLKEDWYHPDNRMVMERNLLHQIAECSVNVRFEETWYETLDEMVEDYNDMFGEPEEGYFQECEFMGRTALRTMSDSTVLGCSFTNVEYYFENGSSVYDFGYTFLADDYTDEEFFLTLQPIIESITFN